MTKEDGNQLEPGMIIDIKSGKPIKGKTYTEVVAERETLRTQLKTVVRRHDDSIERMHNANKLAEAAKQTAEAERDVMSGEIARREKERELDKQSLKDRTDELVATRNTLDRQGRELRVMKNTINGYLEKEADQTAMLRTFQYEHSMYQLYRIVAYGSSAGLIALAGLLILA